MATQATEKQLRQKIAQAYQVIGYLLDQANINGGEGERVLDYFLSDQFDPDFLPWPPAAPEGLKPQELNAANDG